MAVIIGGHETGVQNSSLNLLTRNDTTGSGAAGHGEAIYANVSNGNLVIAHQDAYLPSIGDDYQLVRTYNAWGQIDGDPSGQGRWRLSSTVQVYLRDDDGTTFFEVVYGDGSVYDFRYDSATGLYVCTDGAGAFETLEDLGTGGDPEPSYILTRADQTRLSFDSAGRLIKLEDTNDISIDYIYTGDQLTQVIDDQGHVINYTYQDGRLQQVTDENANVLVQYTYDANGRLGQVIDRAGHITEYYYTTDGFLERIVLPDTQVVDGQTQTYDTRELSFTYDTVDWAGDSQQSVKVLTRITDAQGGITTFDYDFAFEQSGSDTSGTTTVVDALGNNRAYSNDSAYVDWRLENGYYQSYDAAQAAADPDYQAQVDAIKNAHSLAYTYRSDGYISQVIDQQGFHTLYSYDENDNLTSVTDANGWGATHSDSDYYRQMRAELGVTDGSGEGKLVAELTAQEIADLTEAFTSHFEYDDRGNLTQSIDNADNVTTYTYTDFNKLASSTSAVGNALAGGQMTVNPDQAFRNVLDSAVTALSDGGYVVAFTERDGLDGDRYGIFIQRFDADGNKVGAKVQVNSYSASNQKAPSIAGLNGGGFVVTWDSYLQDGSSYGVYGQCFDANGDNVGAEFQVNTTTSSSQYRGQPAALSDGGFVITWQAYGQDGSSYGIFGRRYDSAGNALSGEFQINTYTSSTQQQATVTGLTGGGFAVTWQSYKQDGSYNGIYGQCYDGTGTPVGSEFQVNTTTANNQYYPAITALDGGGFVVVWESMLQDGSGDGIFGQRFDATGTPVGAEFQINTTYEGSQGLPKVAAAAGGGFVVAYHSYDQASANYCVYIQCFDAAGDPLGSETTIFEQGISPSVTVLDNGKLVVAGLCKYEDTDGYTKNQILQAVISADQVQSGQITDLNQSHVTDPLGLEIENNPELLEAYTTYFEYDDNQNLIERRDPGADITRYEYYDNGSLKKKIVCLDAQDPDNPDKQQVTEYGYDAFGNLNSITDAESNTSSSIYDHFGNLVQYTDANGGITSYSYDDDNRLLTVTDPENHTTINTYDAVGNRISITDADGHTITRVYDRNNRLITTIDPSESDPLQDRTTRYEYDVVGNRTAVIDAENHRTEYSFNSRRELVEILTEQTSDENGQPVRYQSTMAYDGAGNRIRTTDYNGNSTEVIYTQNNLIRQQTDPNGHITRYEYDANNNTVQIIAGVQLPEAKRQILQFSYDEENQLIASTDAIGNALAQSNDPVYQQMRSELGYAMLVEDLSVDDQQALRARHTQYTTYDAVGNRVSVTDANGNITEYEYDGNNRLVRETLPEVTDPQSGQLVRYTVEHRYDANGNQIETIDQNGHSTTYTFDRDDRLVMVQDANGIKTVFEYDSRHNRTAVMIGVDASADAQGHIDITGVDQAQITRYTYNEFNQVTAVTDAVGNALAQSNETLYQQMRSELGYATLAGDLSAADQQALRALYTRHMTYDKVGNQLSSTDHLGRTSQYSYDELNRLTSTTDALEHTSTMAYDGNGNLVRQTDALTRTSTYEYDSMNRLTHSTDALDVVTQRQYDDFGNLISQTRAQGSIDERTSTYEYDLNNRLIRQTDPELHSQSYEYDAVGNRIRTTDGRGNSTEYIYDALNRTISIIDPLDFETRYQYDGVGNRIGIIDANNGAIQMDYDPGNRLVSITDAQQRVTTYAYDVRGNRIEQRTAAGTVEEQLTTYEYDAQNNLRRVIDADNGITATDYDRVYNRIETTDANGNSTSYEFDAVNRLIRITDALGQLTQYSYDAVGNQLSQISANGHAVVTRDDAYYRSVRQQAGITDGNGQGKLAADLSAAEIEQLYELYTTHFEYDDTDRLIKQIGPDDIETHYSYDAVGNRTHITRAANTADAVTETFVYDLDDQLRYHIDAEGNALAQSNAQAYQDKRVALGYAALAQNLTEADQSALRDLHTTTYAYDENHNCTTIIDARGNSTVYTYDANNRVSSIQDAENNIVQYTYDGNGNRTQVIDARNFVTTTYYNANNEVTLSVDAEGYATGYTYDDNGNVIRQTLYMTVLSLPLDPAVKPVPTVSADDRTIEFEYDQLNRITARFDAENCRTEYIYDAVGNRLATIGPNADPATSSDQAYYRNIRKQAGIVDGDGNGKLAADLSAAEIQQLKDLFTTRSYYDTGDRQIASVSAQGYLTTYSYDSVGNLISQTLYNDPVSIPAQGVPEPAAGDSGRTTSMIYDAANRLVRQTSAAGVHTDYEYDNRGNRTTVIEAADSADERRTEYIYDNADRLTDTIDALTNVTHLTLDANGNVIEQYEAYGTDEQRLTGFDYDGNNRVRHETRAQGTDVQMTIEYIYDGAGNLTDKTLALGLAEQRTEHMEYDGNNRLTAQVNGEGERTESVYDGAGNRIQLIMAPGLSEQRTNTFEFDRDNRLIAGTDGENVRTEYRYDAAGNKIETIQAVGLTQERQSLYRYDADNRLVSITDPMGAATEYTYDALGNQIRIINANGVVQTNTFDAMGRVHTSEIDGILTENTYDLRGNLVTTTQSYADGTDARTTTYGYDQLDRQTRITDPEGFSTTIEYDAFGNQTLIIHGRYLLSDGDDGYDAAKAEKAFEQSNRFTYDAADRMTRMTDGEGGVVTYSYDAVGNRTGMTDGNGYAMVTSDAAYYLDWRQALGYVDAVGGAKPAGDLTETEIAQLKETFTTHYTYDLANRLIRTDTPEGGIIINTYDEVGNRIEESLLQSDDVWITRTYEYDGNARQTASIDAYNVRTEYEYDAMGNCTAVTSAKGTGDERTTHTEYDLNNRVSADIDAMGNRTEYAYDAMGNRIKATDALGRQAHYYFDGANNLVCILDPEGCVSVFTYDSAGNRTGETVYMNVYTGDVDDYTMPTPSASDQDRVSISQYDGNGRVIRREQADHSVTTYSYDAAGNLKTETQYGTARTLEYSYDLNNRLIQFTDVDDTVTSFTYDGSNNKTSETITHTYANDPNTVRRTTYQYDLNNRQVSQVFDPDGLNLVQATTYDKLGNVTAQTDANGNTTGYHYDLNNRLVRVIDALGNDMQYGYDNVGNQISVTDARGYTTDYVYDDNNRLVQEISPSVDIYTIENEFETIRPTITHQYDTVGNEVQTTDASGYITTRFFDANGRLTAEINGDNALREWTYNAAGEVKTETLYMTRLTDAAHDPDELTRPSGDVRLTTTEYDLGGRVKRIIHPEIDVTSLQGADTDNPTYTVTSKHPEELFEYDAYGNPVVSVDPNENRTVSYYDLKGRLVAQVDALGYLTEYEYDAQDNVIEQWVYVEPLADPAAVDPSVRPTPPSGDVYWTSRTYDVAGRLIEEKSPEVQVYDNTSAEPTTERVVTRYTYDAVGNQTSRTLAADSNDQVTEYMYYNRCNQQVVVIDGSRVVNLFGYDANGNNTLIKRFFNPLAVGIDPTSLTGAVNFAALVGTNSSDQQINYLYDALNRLTSTTDLMAAGSADDLIKTYGYDANGNRTRVVDEDGYIFQYEYDALGQVIQHINADGSGMIYSYDTAGNRVSAYTGQIYGWKTPPSDIAVIFGDELEVAWTMPDTFSGSGYVIYDTVSHSDIDDYAYTSSILQVNGGQSYRVELPTTDVTPGHSIYFRVIAKDFNNNTSWTEERVLTLPPHLIGLEADQTGADSLSVTVQFQSGAVNPTLIYASPGSPESAVSFVSQGGDVYTASLSGIADLQALTYRIAWQDAFGNTFENTTASFEAQGDHTGTAVNVSWNASNEGNDQIVLINGAQVEANRDAGRVVVDSQLPQTGSVAYDVLYGSSAVDGHTTISTSSPSPQYDLSVNLDLLGSQYSLATGGVYLAWKEAGSGSGYDQQAQMSLANIVYGSSIPEAEDTNLSLVLDQVEAELRAETHMVLVDGGEWTPDFYVEEPRYTGTLNEIMREAAGSYASAYDEVFDYVVLDYGEYGYFAGWQENLLDHPDALRNLLIDMGYADKLQAAATNPYYNVDIYQCNLTQRVWPGQYDLKAYYVDSQGNQVVIQEWPGYSTVDGSTVANQNMTIQASQTTATAAEAYYDVGLEVQLSAQEAAAMSGDLRLAWRSAGGGTDFDNEVVFSSSGTGRATYLPQLSSVLAQVEAELRAETYTVLVDGGEGYELYWYETRPRYTGSLNEIMREAAGSYASAYDEVFDYVVLDYGDYGYFAGWQENLLDHPTALRDLLIDMGYAGLLEDGVDDPYYNLEFNQFNQTLRLPQGLFDFKVYYLDTQGNEVIVDWLRLDSAQAGGAVNGFSFTVQASEIDGLITRGADGILSVDPGFYEGAATNILTQEYSLSTSATGEPSGYESAFGEDFDYNIEMQYNALNALIASNAENGLYHEYGVDANGNAVATFNYGLDGSGAAIITYTAYDGRDRVIAEFGPSVTVDGEDQERRIVTRKEYDVQDNIVREIDPYGGSINRTWNALGSQLTETDQLGGTTTRGYDRLGRQTVEIDALGNRQYQYYDAAGNLTGQRDGEGNYTTYAYDVFGRRTQVTNGLGQSVQLSYDHRDRLIMAEDGVGYFTAYEYDGRNNRTVTTDLSDPMVDVLVDLTAAQAASVNGQVRFAWRLTGTADYTDESALTANGITAGTPVPLADNIDFDSVLSEIMAELKALTHTVEVSDGEWSTQTLTVYDYPGSLNEVIRQRAEEMDINLVPYDQYSVFNYQTTSDGENNFASMWRNDLTDHPEELRALLMEMGYSAKLQAAANDPDYQIDIHHFIMDRPLAAGTYDFKVYYLDLQGNEVVVSETQATISDTETISVNDAVTIQVALNPDTVNHQTLQSWDVFNRAVETITFQDGQEVSEKKYYDGSGNLTAEVDAENRITVNKYGAFGRKTQTTDSAGRTTFYEYDDQGRMIREYNPATGKDIRRSYDDAGRLLEVNDLGTGVSTVYTYDIAGNRITEDITGSGHERNVSYEYDAIGQMTRWADSVTGMHINYEWDAAGNLRRTKTDPGYDPLGENVLLSQVLSQVEAELRDYHYWGTYEVFYDYGDYGSETVTETGWLYPYQEGDLNEVLRAAAGDFGVELDDYDNLFRYDRTIGYTGEYNMTITYGDFKWQEDLLDHPDALVNLLRDMGYGDRLDAAMIDANYRYIDHLYMYDDNNRVISITQDGTIQAQYGYDAAGNRTMVNEGGAVSTYDFDANGRVILAESNGQITADWDYDHMGNVIQYRTYNSSGNVDSITTKKYYENSRNYYTNDDGQQTTLTMDLGGRVLTTTVVDGGNTYTYDHTYNAAGLETLIQGRTSGGKGTTVNTYDVNDQLIRTEKGAGDDMDRPEVLEFVYNNDGQILYRFHDTGEDIVYSGYDIGKSEDISKSEFVYANGHAVGRMDRTADEYDHPVLDSGQYNLVQSIGEEYPTSATANYIVSRGDTLQSIAATVYGNPSLWFVLAEANNLDPAIPLQEGLRLEIPGTVKSGRLTVDTHIVYNESEIIGSTLPNLKSIPGEGGGGCGSFLMIVIMAVIAVVACYYVPELAGAIGKALGAAIGGVSAGGAAATAVTVTSYAIAGAVVGTAASIVQQGAFMALGYQDEFSWSAVTSAAISGMLSGAAQGIGEGVKAAEKAGEVVENLKYMKVAAAALKVSSAATRQLIENGQITSWTSLAAAGMGGYLETSRAAEVGTLANKFDMKTEAVESGIANGWPVLSQNLTTAETAVNYITPWAQLAETYVRDNGKLTPTDWANAVGSTLSTAVTKPGTWSDVGIENAFRRSAANMVVAGGLSAFDRNAAQSYLSSAIGNEVGQYIGQWANQKLESLAAHLEQKKAATSMTLPAADSARAQGSVQSPQLTAPTDKDHKGPNELVIAGLESDPNIDRIIGEFLARSRNNTERPEKTFTLETGVSYIDGEFALAPGDLNLDVEWPEQMSLLGGGFAETREFFENLESIVKEGEQLIDGTYRNGFDPNVTPVLSESDLFYASVASLYNQLPADLFKEAMAEQGINPAHAEMTMRIINATKPEAMNQVRLGVREIFGSPNELGSDSVHFILEAEEYFAGDMNKTRRSVFDYLMVQMPEGRTRLGGAAGVGFSALGLGLLATSGAPLIVLGIGGLYELDTFQASLRQMTSAKPTNTIFNNSLINMGMSERTAGLLSLATGFGLGFAAGISSTSRLRGLTNNPKAINELDDASLALLDVPKSGPFTTYPRPNALTNQAIIDFEEALIEAGFKPNGRVRTIGAVQDSSGGITLGIAGDANKVAKVYKRLGIQEGGTAVLNGRTYNIAPVVVESGDLIPVNMGGYLRIKGVCVEPKVTFNLSAKPNAMTIMSRRSGVYLDACRHCQVNADINLNRYLNN